MVVDGSKEEQIEEQLEPVIEATEEYYHGASHFGYTQEKHLLLLDLLVLFWSNFSFTKT